ncbi:hypothetical protein [Algibacter sp. PT7-4]|uniref:hypothetical protein n=1 Tax=Algibacter ulvanivorans TaxID=3400999 RepID=UPI003AAA863B
MSSENDKILAEERVLAKTVAKVTTNYVHSKIKSSSLTMRGIGSPYKKGRSKFSENERKPMLEATYIEPAIGDNRLLGFDFKSNRSGFVHHFGIIKDNTRYLRTHSKTGTVYKQVNPNLKSQSFFDDIYKSSGALQMLENGLQKTRVRAVTFQLQNIVLEMNKQDG